MKKYLRSRIEEPAETGPSQAAGAAGAGCTGSATAAGRGASGIIGGVSGDLDPHTVNSTKTINYRWDITSHDKCVLIWAMIEN